MKTLWQLLQEVATISGSGTVTPPPTDNDDDGDDGGNWWQDPMGKGIWHWLHDQTPCAKKVVTALAETLLNAADEYAPKTIHNSAHVASARGGFGHLTMEWELDIEGGEFDRLEMAIKQILLRDCDIWKYLNVPYQKAFAAVSDDNFLTNFEYNVCQAGPTAMALYPKIKVATYEVVHTYRDEDGDPATHLMVNSFIDQYEYKFKSRTTAADWKITPTFISRRRENPYVVDVALRREWNDQSKATL